MQKILQSPWLAVSLAIVAMTVLYVAYLQRTGGIAAAGGFCPYNDTCTSGECAKDSACRTANCKHCPACNTKAQS